LDINFDLLIAIYQLLLCENTKLDFERTSMQTKCWIFDLAHNPENRMDLDLNVLKPHKDLSSMPAWFQTAIITAIAICNLSNSSF